MQLNYSTTYCRCAVALSCDIGLGNKLMSWDLREHTPISPSQPPVSVERKQRLKSSEIAQLIIPYLFSEFMPSGSYV